MKHMKPVKLCIVLGLVAMAATGCAKKEKEQIAVLTRDKQELLTTNKGLELQLAQAIERESDLRSALDQKDLMIDGLQKRLATKPPMAPIEAPAGWEAGIGADKVTVGSDILFASGRAVLTSKGKAALGRIVNDIKRTYAGMPVRVFGHTDSDPIKVSRKLWADNLDLSANRAMAVTRYLIRNGIKPGNIETIGMGAARPIAGNASAAGKAGNRRVEIIVIKNK